MIWNSLLKRKPPLLWKLTVWIMRILLMRRKTKIWTNSKQWSYNFMSSEWVKICYGLQNNSDAKKCFCVRNPLYKFEHLSCQVFSEVFLRIYTKQIIIIKKLLLAQRLMALHLQMGLCDKQAIVLNMPSWTKMINSCAHGKIFIFHCTLK